MRSVIVHQKNEDLGDLHVVKLGRNPGSRPYRKIELTGRFGCMEDSAMYSRESGSVRHKTYGYNGIRLEGRQPFLKVYSDTLGGDAFFSSDLAQTYNSNTFLMNPLWFRGPLAYKAVSYEYYVFRRVCLEWTGNQSTGSVGQFAMCVSQDGNIGGDIPDTFSKIRQVTPALSGPKWIPYMDLEFKYDGPKIFNVDIQATDTIAANMRDENQGVIYGRHDTYQAASAAGIVWSYMNVSYEIELYSPIYVGTTAALNLMGDGIPDDKKAEFNKLRQAMKKLVTPKKVLRSSDDGECKESSVLDEDYLNIPGAGGGVVSPLALPISNAKTYGPSVLGRK